MAVIKLDQMRDRDIPRIERDVNSLQEEVKSGQNSRITTGVMQGEIKALALEVKQLTAAVADLVEVFTDDRAEWRAEMRDVKTNMKNLQSEVQQLHNKVESNTADIKTLIETTSKSYGILVMVKEFMGLNNQTFAQGVGLMITNGIEMYLAGRVRGRGAIPLTGPRINEGVAQDLPKPPVGE